VQISYQKIGEHLAKENRGLYTVHGNEPLLIQEAADQIRSSARAKGFTERRSFTVIGAHFDWDEVLAACGSMSLFGDQQIIEIHVPSGKPGKEGSVALQNLAEQSKDNTGVLFLVVLPRLDKATKSTGWFEALDSFGVTISVDAVDRNALPAWIAQRMSQNQQRVLEGVEGQRTLQFFSDRVEGNLLAAYQEIQKLALLYPVGELSFEQVESAVLDVSRYDVFKLSESTLAGNHLRVQRMIEGLRSEGVAAVLVHYALAEDVRIIKRIQTALDAGRPLPMAMREQRVWGTKERILERAFNQITAPTVDRLVQAAYQVDGVVKGLKLPHWPADPWQALHRLAMMLTQACQAKTH